MSIIQEEHSVRFIQEPGKVKDAYPPTNLTPSSETPLLETILRDTDHKTADATDKEDVAPPTKFTLSETQPSEPIQNADADHQTVDATDKEDVDPPTRLTLSLETPSSESEPNEGRIDTEDKTVDTTANGVEDHSTTLMPSLPGEGQEVTDKNTDAGENENRNRDIKWNLPVECNHPLNEENHESLLHTLKNRKNVRDLEKAPGTHRIHQPVAEVKGKPEEGPSHNIINGLKNEDGASLNKPCARGLLAVAPEEIGDKNKVKSEPIHNQTRNPRSDNDIAVNTNKGFSSIRRIHQSVAEVKVETEEGSSVHNSNGLRKENGTSHNKPCARGLPAVPPEEIGDKNKVKSEPIHNQTRNPRSDNDIAVNTNKGFSSTRRIHHSVAEVKAKTEQGPSGHNSNGLRNVNGTSHNKPYEVNAKTEEGPSNNINGPKNENGASLNKPCGSLFVPPEEKGENDKVNSEPIPQKIRDPGSKNDNALNTSDGLSTQPDSLPKTDAEDKQQNEDNPFLAGIQDIEKGNPRTSPSQQRSSFSCNALTLTELLSLIAFSVIVLILLVMLGLLVSQSKSPDNKNSIVLKPQDINNTSMGQETTASTHSSNLEKNNSKLPQNPCGSCPNMPDSACVNMNVMMAIGFENCTFKQVQHEVTGEEYFHLEDKGKPSAYTPWIPTGDSACPGPVIGIPECTTPNGNATQIEWRANPKCPNELQYRCRSSGRKEQKFYRDDEYKRFVTITYILCEKSNCNYQMHG